ncbi:chaperone protein dnaJ 20, chloroplastic [Magnolia sinica]|uniref:chaperone protein dnaJ 20, chloroplastic n=1 Tax=Magnolia sinica TaxID=86752 RepID=UPI0026580FC4|nr:chaperone protein dnaJ 20, chloroplastic [Magnolia sinica]
MSSCRVISGNHSSLFPKPQISARKSMETLSFPNFSKTHLPKSQSKQIAIFSTEKNPNRAGRPASLRTRALSTEASFYELLGIPESVGFSEIKQAYKQMARKYHPDVSPPNQTEEYTRRFIQVQEAYETLSDPRLRAMYDRDLARGFHLAFSARKRFDEELEVKSEWRNRWQDQVAGLKRRSMNKDSGDNMSWGARMRKQRNGSSAQ